MAYGSILRPHTPLRGKRFLVAEDEPLLAMDIEAALQDAGAEVVGPADILCETLQLASGEGSNAAILDVNLRGEKAFAAATSGA